MDFYVNQPFVDKRVKFSRYFTWGSLGALAGGLLLSKTNIMVSYGALLIGMVLAIAGSHYTALYVREPRADQVLMLVLDGLDKRYTLYAYYLASNLVVLSHYGFMVLLPKLQKGIVTYRDRRWKHKAGLRRIFGIFGEQGLGNPTRELADEIGQMRKWVAKALPEFEVPVSGAVVFTNPEVDLQADQSDGPVVTPAELYEYLRHGLRGQELLSTAQLKAVRRVCDALVESETR